MSFISLHFWVLVFIVPSFAAQDDEHLCSILLQLHQTPRVYQVLNDNSSCVQNSIIGLQVDGWLYQVDTINYTVQSMPNDQLHLHLLIDGFLQLKNSSWIAFGSSRVDKKYCILIGDDQVDFCCQWGSQMSFNQNRSKLTFVDQLVNVESTK